MRSDGVVVPESESLVQGERTVSKAARLQTPVFILTRQGRTKGNPAEGGMLEPGVVGRSESEGNSVEQIDNRTLLAMDPRRPGGNL